MKSQRTKAMNRCAFIAPALLFALATPILAQRAGPPPDRTDPDKARQQDMSQREWRLRNFGTVPPGSSDRPDVKAVGAQIEQDFQRILILHNEIAGIISADKGLDHHFISEATAEIRKRATRLQTTLALREPESQQANSAEPEQFNDTQIKTALFILCKQIKSFVTNPVIETPGTVSAEQLEKARKDLASLIKLSGRITKNAERLSKIRK